MPRTTSGEASATWSKGVYGEARGTSSLENSAVLVPPDPTPKPVGRGPFRIDSAEAGGRGGRRPAGRRSLFQRLQISPAVIVVAIIAGVTGAAANAWFQDLAGFVSEPDRHRRGSVEAPDRRFPADRSRAVRLLRRRDGRRSLHPEGGRLGPVSIGDDLGSDRGDGGAPILSGASGEGGPAGLSRDEVAEASASGRASGGPGPA